MDLQLDGDVLDGELLDDVVDYVEELGDQALAAARLRVPKRTRKLQRSLRREPAQVLGNGDVVTRVGSTKRYAAALEYGAGAREAQPYLRPALGDVQP